MKSLAALATLSTTFCLLLPPVHAENWPLWRGPNDDGVSKETNLPAEFSDTKNVIWKLPMPGSAGATPVIWGKRLFLTSEEGSDVVVLCVSTDGKELWKKSLTRADKKRFGPRRDEGSFADASPCTDGKHVWAFCGTGEFACFDFDGKEVWRFNAQERYGTFRMQWGTHTSPTLDGDRLYLQLIHGGGAWVIALDKATGKEVWKVARTSDATGESKESYATPSVWHRGTDALLVTHGGDYAIAYRLEDGSEAWRVGGLNPQGPGYRRDYRFVASPLVTPGLIVIPSAKKGPILAVKPDDKGLPTRVWNLPHGTPDVPSPLFHDGLVYLCSEDGRLTCVEAETGKELYSEALTRDRYRASPVYADGKVYLSAREGTVSVVKAGRKFELLAVNKIPEVLEASPAISEGRIYLRGRENLYAIGK